MNPVLRLHEQCQGEGGVSLIIPRSPTGLRIRLTPKGGPLGEVLCFRGGATLAMFDREKVRKFLEKSAPELFGLVK